MPEGYEDLNELVSWARNKNAPKDEYTVFLFTGSGSTAGSGSTGAIEKLFTVLGIESPEFANKNKNIS